MAHKNIIELNGKQYDARTGAIVGNSVTAAKPVQPHASRGRAMDGFFRAKDAPAHGATTSHAEVHSTPAGHVSTSAHAHHIQAAASAGATHTSAAHQHAASAKDTAQVTHQPSRPNPAAKQLDVARSGKKPVMHHPAQKPKTLMRSAVTKPDFKRKPAIKTQAPAEVMAAPIATIVPKASAMQVSKSRLARARHTPLSGQVQHFQPLKSSDSAPFKAPASHASNVVAPGNIAATAQPSSSVTPAAAASAGNHVPRSDNARPIVRGQHAADVRAHSVAARPHAHPDHAASVPARAHTSASASSRGSTDIFEAALARATSHEQTYHRPPKAKHTRLHIKNRKLIGIGAGFGTLLILGGFIAYANMPSIAIRLASANAGFHAQLPGYQPTGYALDSNIKSTSGVVSFSYRSGDSTLNITQQPSSWDSQTLYENAIALNSQKYKSIQSQGHTIYIYNRGDTASWVTGGIRYDITGTADLTTDQITSLAASM